MTRSTMRPLLLWLLVACNFPRPADVGGDAGDDDGPSSNACCVTAEECARIGSSSAKPCQLGVCVQNECTTTVGSCDGNEDCSAGTPVCVNDSCRVCLASTSCPASTPVCDDTSHECRICTKDNECSSGGLRPGGR
jgi:hypothetical protein